MPATVYGNQFIANQVLLTEGVNTITITATDTAGNTAMSSLNVNAVTTGNYIRLSSNIESGIAPLEVSLRLDGTFSIEESNLHVTGPVQPEVLSISPSEYQLSFNTEGVYTITASSTGPDSIVYEDTVAVTVLDKAQLDTLLKGKWSDMTSSLMIQDTTTALTYISSFTKSQYEQMYAILFDQLPGITVTQRELNFLYTIDNITKYELVTLKDGTLYSYEVTFIKDKDGTWKILQY